MPDNGNGQPPPPEEPEAPEVRRAEFWRRAHQESPAFQARPDCVRAHLNSSHHRKQLEESEWCGCFDCLAVFRPAAITRWIDRQETAVCPYCSIDSVIGSASGFPITRSFLWQMREHWMSGRDDEPRGDSEGGFRAKPDYVRAETWCCRHREELEASDVCGCVECLSLFAPGEIGRWVYPVQGVETTAICPRCGAKAVIGSAFRAPMTAEFLEKVRSYRNRAR